MSGSKLATTTLLGVASLVATVAALALPAWAHAAMPTGFTDAPVIEGLTQPVGVDWAANGRAFIVEKHGVLKTAAPGAGTATTVLDMRDQVNDNGDRGLETVAVDKSFATNGFVYLAYVKELRPLVADSDAPMVSKLVRLRLNPSTGQVANPSEPPVDVLGSADDAPCPTAPSNNQDCMPADSTSHMIGTVRTDPDGTLWVGNGDGASFNYTDPLAMRTLDPTSLAGKILHVDRDGKGLPGHAFCPSNTTLTDVCTKVHAKGFRNPFRFQVRPDRKVILGDVGWNTREEIDVVDAPGKSYGWPCREGKIATPGYKDLAACAPYTTATETEPIYDYPRCPADNPPATVCGSAVLGGPEYQADSYPSGYRGSMFVGDYTSYKIFRLAPNGQGGYSAPQVFSDSWLGTDLEIAPDGDLAYVNFGWGTGPDGYVGKISYAAGNRTPVAAASADKTSGPAPLTVAFDGSGSSDPDGDPLTYDWDFGDGTAHATTAKPSHTFTSAGSFTVTLTVSDGRGRSATKTLNITAGGSAPVAKIEAPTAGFTYRDGDTVQLRGSATDADQGNLPASGLSWQTILHHGEHTHFDSTFPGVAEAAFTTRRDHDADSYYEIRLTATDSQGLTHTASVDIRPQTTTARIESTPTGAPVSYGGRSGTTPFSQTTAIGYSTTATAAASFTSGGRPFLFDRWADGVTGNTRNLTVPATGVDLRALYLEDKSRAMPASASTTQDGNPDFGPAAAVDGDDGTRWSSDREDGQHWQVDLGRLRTVSQVQVDWEAAFASSYRILTSTDGTTWSTAADQAQTEAGNRTTSFSPRVARYVRVLGLVRGTHYGLSFFEARVLGPADDSTAPETTITKGPSSDIQATSAEFEFSSNETGSSFQCRLDAGAWASCTSPKTLSSLAPGDHTFYVAATDPSGNPDATPASRSFRVVAAPPALDTTIDSGPTGTITSKSAQLTFSGSASATRFECKLDSGSWAACSSPHQLSALGEGAHTFSVRAHDAGGAADTTPASRGFSVDTVAPDATISSGPSGDTTSTTASFGFSSEAGATFECSLDSGAWATCNSPKAYSGLSVGSHTFEVRATDSAGNADQSPTSRSFRVVAPAAPDTTIDSGPSGSTIGTNATQFAFSGSASAARFECKLDSGGWNACSSTHTLTGLSEGAHTFSVRAHDASGTPDPTPATSSFSVDTTPPDTTINSGPSGDITTTSATFGFSSEAGATFQCRLDSGSWAACTSPKTFSGLSRGSHSVQVRARDTFGRYDPTPASRSFRVVDRTPPNTTITSGPSGTVSGSSQRFTFSSEAGATFQCKLDSGSWVACVSPRTLTGLKAGAHVFQVRARDSAGNIDATPARRDFRIAAASTQQAPLSSASYRTTVHATRGLTALYGLGDEGAVARTTRARPGAYHGSPRRAKALVKRSSDSRARRFDGRNDWMELDPHALTRRKTFSVELWMKAGRPRRRTPVLALFGAAGGGLGLDLDASARPRLTARFARKRAAHATGPVLRRGRAHYVVATFDGRRLRLYVDGKPAASNPYRSGIGPGRSDRLTLGGTPTSSRRFKGILDELAFYDRALSPRQVRAHYNAGR